MKANFNGMRRNATSSMNNLADYLENIITKWVEDGEELMAIELSELYNTAAVDVDGFNSLYDADKRKFTSLIDEIEVRKIDIDELLPEKS